MGNESLSVSHLQFEDDTISFLEANERNIKNMEICLKIFELILGLKVNMSKSCLVGINIEEQSVRNLAELIGYKVEARPIKCLRVPLRG